MITLSFGKKDTEKTNSSKENYEIAQLRREFDDLRADFDKLKLKNENYIADNMLIVKELRERIEKKMNYINNKENQVDVKQALRNKMLRTLGVKPQDLNNSNNIGVSNEQTLKD